MIGMLKLDLLCRASSHLASEGSGCYSNVDVFWWLIACCRFDSHDPFSRFRSCSSFALVDGVRVF